MITAIEHQESKMYDCHINCLNAIKPLLPPVNEALEELKAKEEEGNFIVAEKRDVVLFLMSFKTTALLTTTPFLNAARIFNHF